MLRRLAFAIASLCLSAPAALAACGGAGGLPFSCDTFSGAMGTSDLLMGGHGSASVQISGAQILQMIEGNAATVTQPWTFSGGLTGTLTGGASLDLPLAGGTLTGPLTGTSGSFPSGLTSTPISGSTGAFTTLGASGVATLTGTGTALSVTNNASVGGTLGVTGVTTLNGNLVANAQVNIGNIFSTAEAPGVLLGGFVDVNTAGDPVLVDNVGTLYPQNGLYFTVRRITSGSTDTATYSDDTVAWRSASGAAKAESIPACLEYTGYPTATGQFLTIKDEQGDANTNPITITPAGGTIDGASNYVIGANHGSVTLQCDPSSTSVADAWRVVAGNSTSVWQYSPLGTAQLPAANTAQSLSTLTTSASGGTLGTVTSNQRNVVTITGAPNIDWWVGLDILNFSGTGGTAEHVARYAQTNRNTYAGGGSIDNPQLWAMTSELNDFTNVKSSLVNNDTTHEFDLRGQNVDDANTRQVVSVVIQPIVGSGGFFEASAGYDLTVGVGGYAKKMITLGGPFTNSAMDFRYTASYAQNQTSLSTPTFPTVTSTVTSSVTVPVSNVMPFTSDVYGRDLSSVSSYNTVYFSDGQTATQTGYAITGSGPTPSGTITLNAVISEASGNKVYNNSKAIWLGTGFQIALDTTGATDIWSDGSAIHLASPGGVVLPGSTSGNVTLGVPAVAGTTTFKLPGSNGAAGNLLLTDGSGNTSWSTGLAVDGTGNITGTSGSFPSGLTSTPISGSTGAFTTLGASGAANLSALSVGTEFDLKASCGAVGNGLADDSGALKACIGDVNASYAAGKPAWLHVPVGIYLIKNTNGTMPAFAPNVPGSVIGDGPHKSYFSLDPGYSGNLFAWSEAWSASSYVSPFNPAIDYAGPTVKGIAVTGSKSAAAQQNAFAFLDRNDYILMRDVEVHFINGSCFAIGSVLNQPQAYARESNFYHVLCDNAGSATVPAVTISSTTTSGSDGTNELNFYGLSVIGATGTGLVLSNPNGYDATRLIRFYGLRVEGSGKDDVDVGLSTDSGTVDQISFYNLDLTAVSSGYFGLNITSGGSGSQPYDIDVHGGNIGGTGSGVNIGYGRLISLHFNDIATTGTAVTRGAGAGDNITVDGDGYEANWTYSDASGEPLELRRPYQVFGIPNSPGQAGAAVMHATTTGATAVRLTMDGNAASGTNCFNSVGPEASKGYAISVLLVAQDTTSSANRLAWTMPISYFSVFGGAGLTAGTPASVSGGTGSSATVAMTADATNKCVDLAFTAPSGNTDTWQVTANLQFARAP